MTAESDIAAEPAIPPTTRTPAPVALAERYSLLRRLGGGATADVYLAHDERLGRDVAVKLFRADVPTGLGEARIETEMRTLAALRHPGLVTAYDAGVDDEGSADGNGRPFLVMELVDGETLAQRLVRGPLSAGTTAAMILSVAGTLAYVHASGIVHRDVKPANILLEADASHTGAAVKLADFGVARLAERTGQMAHTAVGTTVGTAAYLSPEQAAGRDVTPASDVYSLGIVALECLTGQPAFPGQGIEAAAARLHRDPEIPAFVDEGWRALLTDMTARDPLQRPSASEVARRLQSGRPLPPVAPRSDDPAVTDQPTTVLPIADPIRLDDMTGSDTDSAATRMLRTVGAAASARRPVAPPVGASALPDAARADAAGGTPSRSSALGRARSSAMSLLHGSSLAWVVAGAAALLVLVVILLAATGGGPSTPPGGSGSRSGASTAPSPYPSVPGQLGTDLRRLEGAVG